MAPPAASADWRAVLEVGLTDTGQWSITAGPQAPAAALPPAEPPRRRLSLLRLLVAACLLAGLGYGGYFAWRTRLEAGSAARQTWFAPYVDVTLPPTYQFQNASANPARQTVLGFVVASQSAPCTPSWGAAYTMAQANQSLALGSRVAQLQQDGAQVIASFGGEAHSSLDVACTSAASLARAYQSVIDEYHLSVIDLDIEGAALDNVAAARRRAEAIAALEQSARAAHRKLAVWLTLPVEPSGLQDNALSVLESMLRARASITGVNVMAMDFAHPPAAGASLLPEVESALDATHNQLLTVFPRFGLRLRAAQVWQRVGVTVMAGQNDIRGERFTVANARGLTAFASRYHLGRVSMWSLNRDSQCGSSFAETGLLSNTCSGTAQGTLAFSHVFGQIHGQAPATSRGDNVLLPKPNLNPSDAPYPQWSPTASYPQGYKVVESGEIYEAKWYTSGEDPAAQVQYDWQTPWELLGPVLPGDHAPARRHLPVGTYPAWTLATVYRSGDKVLYQGEPYRAKWTNQGVSPGAGASGPSGSPWRPMFRIPGEPAG